MRTNENRRKPESENKIEQAFSELVQEHDIDRISVTMICKRANVNRSTFYAGYLDIRDLMDNIEEKMTAISKPSTPMN
ncbi:TetR/AcrR family transcriptional regulator [Bifidobacterium bohemicum]|uniref:TetR family transcriptional regulator n=1 Tax=Bifidobacterium bohemicum DSM 22767 TaxID=1437606 RepID=A0A086ZJD2_9BIFI|nr:TetR/AcrR family transcriptional regulator [Bifidobacterium bohemicum]KFI46632.1 TetR family transcriptional regulator [Bifidobacterium bohemicum DSM 22767]